MAPSGGMPASGSEASYKRAFTDGIGLRSRLVELDIPGVIHQGLGREISRPAHHAEDEAAGQDMRRSVA